MSFSCLLFYYFTFIFFLFTTYILQFQFSQFLCLLALISNMLKLLYTPYIYPVTQLFFFFMIFLITLFFGFLGMLYIPDLQCPHFLSEQFSNPNVTSSSQLVACCTELYMRWVCVCHKLMFPFCYHLYIFFMSRYTADGQKRYCTVYSVSVCVFSLQCDSEWAVEHDDWRRIRSEQSATLLHTHTLYTVQLQPVLWSAVKENIFLSEIYGLL